MYWRGDYRTAPASAADAAIFSGVLVGTSTPPGMATAMAMAMAMDASFRFRLARTIGDHTVLLIRIQASGIRRTRAAQENLYEPTYRRVMLLEPASLEA